MSSLLSVGDLTPAELRRLVEVARDLKRAPQLGAGKLAGKTIGLFFEKPSLRTWVSCDVAAVQLGAHPVAIRNEEAGLGTREPAEDMGKVLGRYLDALGMRVRRHTDLETVAAVAGIPVVNLLSDREHPCQALADLVTIAERVGNTPRVAFVGDGNNVCHSLMLAVTMWGGSIRVATPPGYEPHSEVVASARRWGEVELGDDPRWAVEGAQVVYTDVWASMGQESEADQRRRAFEGFVVDSDLMDSADSSAVFMHCLPAHRGEEVTAEVLEGPRSVVFDQAENRLHAFKAVLLWMFGVVD
ncbi:MAG: ornithine carbamoyltransferase [Acidimicrobiia bacterium]|nr:MAG: ornithine carbamoyltransferase [Acidimicrobiia bacterium]